VTLRRRDPAAATGARPGRDRVLGLVASTLARRLVPIRLVPIRLVPILLVRLARLIPIRQAAILLVPILLVTAGCAGSLAPVEPGPAAVPDQAAAAPADPSRTASRPERLRIPSISVDTGLIDLGLRADGTMEVPADGSTAGWYVNSPAPGEIGPAVLAAHVDWKGEKGVFYELRNTEPGDEIDVQRADGRTATFTVRRVEQYPKERFPTDTVYGDVDTAQLRLITCGGEFDAAARSYRDNIVVYAELAA
jgi:sortase (surface protein transpeptidase)